MKGLLLILGIVNQMSITNVMFGCSTKSSCATRLPYVSTWTAFLRYSSPEDSTLKVIMLIGENGYFERSEMHDNVTIKQFIGEWSLIGDSLRIDFAICKSTDEITRQSKITPCAYSEYIPINTIYGNKWLVPGKESETDVIKFVKN